MSKDNSTSNFVENILIILSNLPPGLRAPIIKKRLKEFKAFDEIEKRDIINNILKIYNKLERSKILSLMDSWLNSLSEMDSYDINSIFYIYLTELYLNSLLMNKIDKSLISALIDLIGKLPENKRDKIITCFFESLLNTPDPEIFLNIIPINLIL